ncbi:MAG TPA: hypothetical protein VII75_12685 [Thermoanaerobaculia bacterium]|nr:hypothetical protein [Thermoanaerobaculia bacterium]
MNRRVLTLLLLIGCAAAIHAQPAVSICDVIADPAKYDGKVVQVRGTYFVAFEAAVLQDARCGRSSVWVHFDEHVTGSEKWARAMPHRDRHTCQGGNAVFYESTEVRVTFTGRLDARKRSQPGFGHLNAYDFQLHVTAIDRIGSVAALGRGYEMPEGQFSVTCEMADELPL